MGEDISYDRVRQQGSPFRSNLFVARFISLPSALTDGQELTLKVENLDTPEGDFENTERFFVNEEIRFPSGKNKAQDIDIEFDMDMDQFPKNFFYNWQELVRSNITNTGGLPSMYKGYIRIVALSDVASDANPEEAEELRYYNLLGAWPQNVAGVPLDYGDNDKVTFSTTFSVDNYVETPV